MADSRIDDLRRRVQQDPASMAFAPLAEELRRAGQYQQAVQVAIAGLARHPGYHSARVALGRALLELGRLDEAHRELQKALDAAPDNLAGIRALADVYTRRGNGAQALEQYSAALRLAPEDADLVRLVNRLSGGPGSAAVARPETMGRDRGTRIVAALERWLVAVQTVRSQAV